ncbi:type II toxin-antitoxin system HicB family antitoxin [Candidatus Magnetaquicoccus inordinatus]|uniref:type II toxin-antitoxin system HicB family antitoxin n=1 Tax=Candidatus Magnetaquicoccus inordinatus TaxID=2496818 RepID=UPI00102C076F|nr:type II toxin-antitoxin system HicB family antitoxin [Candidatus Magnetaquicoccus inordinatus]
METPFYFPVVIRQLSDQLFQAHLLDLPETTRQQTSLEAALTAVKEALIQLISQRMRANQSLPIPAPPRGKERHWVALPLLLAAKAMLYQTMRQQGISKTALAKRLDHDEKEIRRLLDPAHPSKIARLEHALAVLGRQLIVAMPRQPSP